MIALSINMNIAFWFMFAQILMCLGGAVGFGYFLKDFWMGYVWFCYGCANVGFSMKALGY